MMLEVLARIRDNVLPALLESSTPWNSLAVRYETPFVDRVWMQYGDYRINLHKIYPCDKPLFHPHPWPSAVEIFSGAYEMGIGEAFTFNGIGFKPTRPVATTILCAGARYEMVHPRGYHYVKPIGIPSMSLMITGKPWKQARRTPGKGLRHHPLEIEVQAEILEFFRQSLCHAA